jgi:hypothetical protein
MHQAKHDKTNHNTQMKFSTNYYMFRHHSAILGEFNNNKEPLSPTRTLGASGPEFLSLKFES